MKEQVNRHRTVSRKLVLVQRSHGKQEKKNLSPNLIHLEGFFKGLSRIRGKV